MLSDIKTVPSPKCQQNIVETFLIHTEKYLAKYLINLYTAKSDIIY